MNEVKTEMKYKVYNLGNFRTIPQISKLSEEQLFEIEVVGNVLPFKVNNYVVDELINWDDVPNDPIFILTFPQKGMLKTKHFRKMAHALKDNDDKEKIKSIANEIRWELNPHPAGQIEKNVPEYAGIKLTGVQHKYRETLLFFPSQGQTCHAYCTFCFRWPQFVGIDELKFAMKETELVVGYIKEHKEISDILFTGGDPLIMKAKVLSGYLESLIHSDLEHLKTIRLGTKALGYWPYKFVTDDDADELMALFKRIVDSGKHLSIMAHFNHPKELETPIVKEAIRRIRNTGAQIRTQSPIMKHINDNPNVWSEMWKKQVELGCIPYYMFIARDTGAQDYFAVPLHRAWEIFRKAYRQVSGLARTVRGPSMSTNPGKIQVLGISKINNDKIFVLRFLQGRNPKWVQRPFFAKFKLDAIWLDDLEPYGEDTFFFEKELTRTFKETMSVDSAFNLE